MARLTGHHARMRLTRKRTRGTSYCNGQHTRRNVSTMLSPFDLRHIAAECVAKADATQDPRLRTVLFQTSRLCREAALIIEWPCVMSDDDNPPLAPTLK